MSNDEIAKELESIKKLLIIQLLRDGVPHADVAKATGMSTKTLYKFIPKNASKIKNRIKQEEKHENE